jgi:hypothetical protein
MLGGGLVTAPTVNPGGTEARTKLDSTWKEQSRQREEKHDRRHPHLLNDYTGRRPSAPVLRPGRDPRIGRTGALTGVPRAI